VDYDFSKHTNVQKWFARIQAEAVKYNKIEGDGIKAFKDFMDTFLKKK